MIKYILLLSIIFCAYQNGTAQAKWIWLDNATTFDLSITENYTDVFFREDTGWAITNKMRISKTIDNGNSWNNLGFAAWNNYDSTNTRVFFRNNNEVICYKTERTVSYSYTLDNGANWKIGIVDSSIWPTYLRISSYQNDIYALGPKTINTNLHHLYKTNDSMQFVPIDSLFINSNLYGRPSEFQVIDSFLVFTTSTGVFYHKIGIPNHLDTLTTQFAGALTRLYYQDNNLFVVSFGSTYCFIELYDIGLNKLQNNPSNLIFPYNFSYTNISSICALSDRTMNVFFNEYSIYESKYPYSTSVPIYVAPAINRITSSGKHLFGFGKGIFKRLADAVGISIDNNTNESAFDVYPNPSNGLIHVDFSAENKEATIWITDLIGKVVYENKADKVKGNAIKLNVDPGIYLIYYRSEKNSYSKKIKID